MKKILISFCFLIASMNNYAGVFTLNGNVQSEDNKLTISEPCTYTLQAESSHKIETLDILKISSCNEFIGASGRSHTISDMFATYSNRALSMGDGTFSFVSNHDADVFVLFDKKGATYTVEIYTGEDALVKKKALTAEKSK